MIQPMTPVNETTTWLMLAASALLLGVYEAWALWTGARHPERVARSLNGNGQPHGAPPVAGTAIDHPLAMLSPRVVLEISVMLVLFASYVCSAMAMRFFNHAGFVMSMPVGSEARQPFMPLAAEYVERAGLLYSWGLRCFLAIAPLVAGIVTPLATLPMTILLVVVLWYFDRPAGAGVA